MSRIAVFAVFGFAFSAGCSFDAESVGEAAHPLWEDNQTFLDNAPIGIHRVLPDGTIAYANEMDYSPLGLTAGQWIGTLIQNHHVDQSVIDDIFARLFAGETLHNYPARLRAADNSIVYVSIQSRMHFDGGVPQHTRCFTSVVSCEVYKRLKNELN